MLGAIIGDIVGSRFEFDNHRSKEFELFTHECFPTDIRKQALNFLNKQLLDILVEFENKYDMEIYKE